MHHERCGDVRSDRLSLGLLIGEHAEEVAQSGGPLLRGQILLGQAHELHELVHVPTTERDRNLILYDVSMEGFGEIGVALLQRLPIVKPRRVALVLRPRHCLEMPLLAQEDPLAQDETREPASGSGTLGVSYRPSATGLGAERRVEAYDVSASARVCLWTPEARVPGKNLSSPDPSSRAVELNSALKDIFPTRRSALLQEMAPTPTYDFVVVGGFHAPDDHAKSHPIAAANASFLNEQDSERLTASVTSALKSAGGGRNLVRRTDGRNADDRSLLADVLEAAVREGGRWRR